MREHFRDSPIRETRRGTIDEKLDPSERYRVKVRQGHASTTKVRVVCRPCNNGWMSRLESDAKPALTSLLDGTPITLNLSQQAIVTHWVVMKLMVSEWINRKIMFSGGERFAFKDRRELPHPLGITLLMHDDEEWKCNYYAVSLTVSFDRTATAQNTKVFSFGVGRAFFNILYSRVRGMSVDNNIGPPHFDLHPSQGRVLVWPLEANATGQQLAEIANYLRTIARRDGGAWMEISGISALPTAPASTPWEPTNVAKSPPPREG